MEGMGSTSSLPVPLRRTQAIRQINSVTGIPPHSLAAFGLFLGIIVYF